MQQRSGSSTSSSSFLTSTTASTMSNRSASNSSSRSSSRRGYRGTDARRGTKPIRSSSLNRTPQRKTNRNQATPGILDPSYWSSYNLNSLVGSPMTKALEMVDYVGQTFQKAVYSSKDDPNSQPDLDQLSQEESEKEDTTESYDDDEMDMDMGHEVEYCEPEVHKVVYTLPSQYEQPPARHRTTRKLGRLNRQNLHQQQKQQQTNMESPTSVLPLSSFLEASVDETTYSMSDADSTLEGLDFVDDWSMYSKGSQSTALSSLADARLMQVNRCEV